VEEVVEEGYWRWEPRQRSLSVKHLLEQLERWSKTSTKDVALVSPKQDRLEREIVLVREFHPSFREKRARTKESIGDNRSSM